MILWEDNKTLEIGCNSTVAILHSLLTSTHYSISFSLQNANLTQKDDSITTVRNTMLLLRMNKPMSCFGRQCSRCRRLGFGPIDVIFLMGLFIGGLIEMEKGEEG